jgi:hypothetical protein
VYDAKVAHRVSQVYLLLRLLLASDANILSAYCDGTLNLINYFNDLCLMG